MCPPALTIACAVLFGIVFTVPIVYWSVGAFKWARLTYGNTAEVKEDEPSDSDYPVACLFEVALMAGMALLGVIAVAWIVWYNIARVL